MAEKANIHHDEEEVVEAAEELRVEGAFEGEGDERGRRVRMVGETDI